MKSPITRLPYHSQRSLGLREPYGRGMEATLNYTPVHGFCCMGLQLMDVSAVETSGKAEGRGSLIRPQR